MDMTLMIRGNIEPTLEEIALFFCIEEYKELFIKYL